MSAIDAFNGTYEDAVAFDDSERIALLSQSILNSSVMDTSGVDRFRQGVEIVTVKHFYAGSPKIHSGEPGHFLRQSTFGQGPKSTPTFNETEGTFSPNEYVDAQSSTQSEQPSIVGTTLDRRTLYDGAIDALATRDSAHAFLLGTDVRTFPHDVRGTIESGNTDLSLRTSIVSYDQNVNIEGDVNAAFNEILVTSSSLSYGVSTKDDGVIDPFFDRRLLRNAPGQDTYASDLGSAISAMTSSSTDSYAATRGAIAALGWQFDRNNNVGADSIAFGGMTF